MTVHTPIASREAGLAFGLRSGSATVFIRPLPVTEEPEQSRRKYWCLDLELVSSSQPPVLVADPSFIDLDQSQHDAATFSKSLRALLEDITRFKTTNRDSPSTILRLVFSYESGSIARSDFLAHRLNGCEGVRLAVGFLDPLSPVVPTGPGKASTISTAHDLLGILKNAVGGIITHSVAAVEGTEELRRRLDNELTRRLSFPWVVKEPLTRSRVFWVQGRANIDASQQFYQAAKALGITLVVLDEPGHWMENDSGPYAHYREAFIPICIDGDDGLTDRIVEAVRPYPYKVDGIVSISDVRLPLVARACEVLGLPTSPSIAYELAGDKGATRELESAAAGGNEGFVLGGAGDLDDALANYRDHLRYPLIVKPCTGWNSDCVVKVRNESELYAAVRRASARHANSAKRNTRVVVEPYIDGPEVDVNFIVLDGEVLFCDVVDDFPSSGDLPGMEGSKTANFMETLMDVPSSLPAEEKEMMRESLRESISRLGFQSGVFHIEARVRGSRARYEACPTTGIVDLYVAGKDSRARTASCYLHEVNARSPGYINCVAALLAHGVDYYAARLLLSLGSRENTRLRALAQPFLGGEPQYVLGLCVLPPTRGGIMASEDAALEFLQAHPELAKHVVHHQTIKQQGDVVQGPDSSELWCVAYIIVASREGRKHCLELVQEVREKFDYRLVGE